MGPSTEGDAPPLTLDPQLARRVLVGQLWAAPVRIAPTAAALETEFERCSTALREAHAGRSPAEIPELRPARELYRLFGIDPTKTRPSSEALLRRVLRGKPLPRISNAVDLCNLMALRFLLPIGLYDADTIDGEVRLAAGQPGESYVGVRKDQVHLGGRPVLADRLGPFGNPTADSLRTAVTESTRALWMVVFAPATFAAERMEVHLATAADAMQRHLAGPSQRVQTRTAIPHGGAQNGLG